MRALFVDESKSNGYLMVAVLVNSGNRTHLRRQVGAHRLKGQRRIHFTKEQDARRKTLLTEFAALGFTAYVFRSTSKDQAIARQQCLAGIVSLAQEQAINEIILERDESLRASDKQHLYLEVKRHGMTGQFRYRLEAPQDEPLLWVADGIAWGYAKGGMWRARVAPLIIAVR